MKKILLCLCLLAMLGTYTAKAEQFVGQLILNYQDNNRDETIPFALITHKEIIPLNFQDTSKVRRSLIRYSGDIVKVEGDAVKREIVNDPALTGAIPPEAREFVDSAATTSVVVEGINVIQIGFPIYEMKFSGEIKLKYIPEIQESVFEVRDQTGVTRKMLVPKYIHEEFVAEYFGRQVEVTVRIIRQNGADIFFVKDIEIL